MTRKRSVGNLISAAGVALLLISPLIVLQWIDQPSSATFPIFLFGMLWLMAAIFAAIIVPLFRSLGKGYRMSMHPATMLLSAFLLVLLAATWGGIVNDQMPCFLGVPNCD
ncbi:MAG: hypothetical protein WKF34_03625 [Pyrinomonadaceae bacterium]